MLRIRLKILKKKAKVSEASKPAQEMFPKTLPLQIHEHICEKMLNNS